MFEVRLVVSWNSSLHFAHNLSNVHTWAMFFLRHHTHMSFMVPFWASTGSGSVPIWGARVWSHAIQRRLFIVLMTAAHISPSVFSLRKFLSNIQRLFVWYIIISFILIIHHIYTHIYTFYFTCLIHDLISLDLHGRLAALGSLCPIHW